MPVTVQRANEATLTVNVTSPATQGTTQTLTTSGGSGTPAGSSGQIQYNNAGAFGGATGLFYDSSTALAGTTEPSSDVVDYFSTGESAHRVFNGAND